MPWMTGAAIVGSSLISGMMGSSAASDAADTQAQSTQLGIDEQRREYDLTRADQEPYRKIGTTALDRIKVLLGMGDPNQQLLSNGTPWRSRDQIASDYNASGADLDRLYNGQGPAQSVQNFGDLNKKFSIADFWNDPVVSASYQSGLDLGTKALKNMAPLTTGLDSGAAAKELLKFGTDYTGNMAAGSQARYVGDQTNQFNRLAGLAGVGQQAVNATGAAGANMANNVSGLISAQGNANAGAKIAGANAWSGGMNSIANWWNQSQMLDKLRGGGGGYSASNVGSYGNFNMPPNPYANNAWNEG